MKKITNDRNLLLPLTLNITRTCLCSVRSTFSTRFTDRYWKCSLYYKFCLLKNVILFKPYFPFCTLWKRQKTSDFSGGMEMEHSAKMIETIFRCDINKMDHLLSTYAKIFEKLTFLTPWYAYLRNFVNVLDEWTLVKNSNEQ